MEWIPTTHKKRSELVKELRGNGNPSCVRGNFVWMVSNSEIFVYKIKKCNDVWEYAKFSEYEFSEEDDSCPASYLNISDIKNPSWRKVILEGSESDKLLKKQIKEGFERSLETKEKLVISVITETQGTMFLEVESVTPLLGRHNGKLYRIPLRRIDSWKIKSP